MHRLNQPCQCALILIIVFNEFGNATLMRRARGQRGVMDPDTVTGAARQDIAGGKDDEEEKDRFHHGHRVTVHEMPVRVWGGARC